MALCHNTGLIGLHNILINDNIVDLIFGKDADYDSSKVVEDAIKKEYSSHGTSKHISDSPQGMYNTMTLLCGMYCK